MKVNLSEKLKALRKEKHISQEKLAQYLKVSFQAVSKWENAQTYPDIDLLPDLARFFGITIDELLQADKLDEKKLYQEYQEKTVDLARTGRIADTIPIWQEAYHKMPNNIEVKEMLMSAYYDTDKNKYQKEIVELGTELYNSDCESYYKGQAIQQIACTYAATGDREKAEQWACRAYQLMHSREMLLIQITDNGEEMLQDFRFANYWYFNSLFYMAMRLSGCETVPGGVSFKQSICKAIVSIYEIVYPNSDMPFEDLRNLCTLHRCIAEDEVSLGKEESIIDYHLRKAVECAEKAANVKEHELKHPLVMNWRVYDAPTDHKQIIRMLKNELDWSCFDTYRGTDWFIDVKQRVENLL